MPSPTARPARRRLSVALALGLITTLAIAVVADILPAVLLYGYLTLSLLTFGLYARDKSAAIKGGWRTPERTLHLWALLGGWPGALLAQQWLRHKSQKRRFRLWCWLTVGLNGLLLGWLCSSQGLPLRTQLAIWSKSLANWI